MDSNPELKLSVRHVSANYNYRWLRPFVKAKDVFCKDLFCATSLATSKIAKTKLAYIVCAILLN